MDRPLTTKAHKAIDALETSTGALAVPERPMDLDVKERELRVRAQRLAPARGGRGGRVVL